MSAANRRQFWYSLFPSIKVKVFYVRQAKLGATSGCESRRRNCPLTGVVPNPACNQEGAIPRMKPGQGRKQAVMRIPKGTSYDEREGVEPRQVLWIRGGRGVMRNRRQYRVSTQRYQTPTLSGVRVHGMLYIGSPQELGRSPQNRSLVDPVTRIDVAAASVINPHKGERRFPSVGEVRSVRSSASSRSLPGTEKGCG